MTSYQIFDKFELVYADTLKKNRLERVRLASLTGYYLRVDAPCLDSSGFSETPENADKKLARVTKSFSIAFSDRNESKGKKGGRKSYFIVLTKAQNIPTSRRVSRFPEIPAFMIGERDILGGPTLPVSSYPG